MGSLKPYPNKELRLIYLKNTPDIIELINKTALKILAKPNKIMDDLGKSVETCRLCKHYNPEGRRGGICEKLDVHVRSTWNACSLVSHPFESSWQPIDDLTSLLHQQIHEKIHERTHDKIHERNYASSEAIA